MGDWAVARWLPSWQHGAAGAREIRGTECTLGGGGGGGEVTGAEGRKGVNCRESTFRGTKKRDEK
jgi:hypothetical protein